MINKLKKIICVFITKVSNLFSRKKKDKEKNNDNYPLY